MNLKLGRGLLLGALVGWAGSSGGRAQLAITEVMSAPWANTATGFRGAEYWELTNFGTNDVNLDGYGFRDGVASRPLVREPFTNLVLGAGESMVFFRVADAKDSVTNAFQFRQWWGDGRLPAGLKFRTWKAPGLSGWDGDAVWLFDSGRKLVDGVQFGRAHPGRAFTYDLETGVFGGLCVAGVGGAFSAERSDDVGSPGTAPGAVLLRFLNEPGDERVDAGMAVTFRALATGFPAPRYQWWRRGEPIPGATAPELVLANVQPADAGDYRAVVNNGLASVASAVALLTVGTDPAAPSLVQGPGDASVFDRQTAVFSVLARGLPAPAYQWRSNGVDIAGAVGPRLELPEVERAWSGSEYSVRITNAWGAIHAAARLTVSARPDLRFTEVMALPYDEEGNRHFDWFEVTNFEPRAVDLTGWRFADQPSFARAVVITNRMILQPGESAVFAERLDARLFANWWGGENLPPGLQVFTYSGFGLGYLGEQLYLWNAAALDPHDSLASVSWAAATLGVSFETERWCDPGGLGCLDEAIVESAVGVRGAFRAGSAVDVGSPGYVRPPSLSILSVQRRGDGNVTVRCRVVPGRAYRLWRAGSMRGGEWSAVASGNAAGNVLELVDPAAPAPAGPASFYRVEELP